MDNEIISKILDERANKNKDLLSLSNKNIILSISINMPGFPKNINTTDSGLKVGLSFIINSKLFDYVENIDYKKTIIGNYLVLFVSKKIENKISLREIKKLLYSIEIENRFLDFDLYFENKAISGKDINLENKKCIVCQKDFYSCRGNHDLNVVRNKMIEIIESRKKYLNHL